MPNYVRNVIKFKKVNNEIVDKLITKLSNPNLKMAIDFNNIIPQPNTKAECPKKYLASADEHIQLIDGKEWFDWYDWNSDKWGTKWNAVDSYMHKGKSWVTFVFDTAWKCPLPIFNELAKLGYDMEIKYADEDYGYNCGRFSYDKELKALVEEPIENERQFARNLWNNY